MSKLRITLLLITIILLVSIIPLSPAKGDTGDSGEDPDAVSWQICDTCGGVGDGVTSTSGVSSSQSDSVDGSSFNLDSSSGMGARGEDDGSSEPPTFVGEGCRGFDTCEPLQAPVSTNKDDPDLP
jgi:hypothetical protein